MVTARNTIYIQQMGVICQINNGLEPIVLIKYLIFQSDGFKYIFVTLNVQFC